LIELGHHNEKLVVMVLFDNGSGDRGANATAATIANGQDVNGVLHGSKSDGGRIDQAVAISLRFH
jgi:hypothetical protein